MPADVNKSVEVSVRADLKQLLNNLKQIPGMTDKEAKKMVTALNRQLRQTEAASKKAAKASVKATKQMEQGFNRAAKSAGNARKQSREIGAALGSLEDVVGGINPELAGMAMEIGIAGQAFRSLSRSMATGNPIIIGIIGTLALAAGAYTIFTAESRKAKELQEALAEAMEKVKETAEAQLGIISDVVGDYNEATRSLMVLTGEMTQIDADILKAKESIQAKADKNLETQEKIIAQENALLGLVRKAQKNRSNLTDEEEKQLNVALSLNKVKTFGGILSDNAVKSGAQLNRLEEEVLGNLGREQKFRERILEGRDKEYQARKEFLQLQEELRKEQEEEAKRQQKIDEYKARQAKKLQELQSILNNLKSQEDQLENKIFQSMVQRLDPYEKLNTLQEKEKQALQDQRQEIENQLKLARETATTKKQKLELEEIEKTAQETLANIATREHQLTIERQLEISELNKKAGEEKKKLRDEEAKHLEQIHKHNIAQIQAGIDASTQGMSTFATSSVQFLELMGNKNRELINGLYKIQQAAALADIAMSTARAIARAPADYGPLAPIAVPIIAAGGAAQAAVVLATPPPMHMGGIVGGRSQTAPDERVQTLLDGEAVLDRRTTRALGNNGVNRLQNGQGMEPQVIVISPFKHLDRFNRSARRLQQNKPRGAGRY
jgi:hypothetical protein